MTREDLNWLRERLKRSAQGRYYSPNKDSWRPQSRKHAANDLTSELITLLERCWQDCLQFDGGRHNCPEDTWAKMEELFA